LQEQSGGDEPSPVGDFPCWRAGFEWQTDQTSPMIQTRSSTEAIVRIIGAVVLVWLVIGALAGAQRGYYKSADQSCASTGTAIVTIVAGPLNYVGANPKVHCKVPQPSS
jgi:hypothetical protein